MSRPITLFTGQWADMPLADLAERAAAWGYDGLELASWGDHLDVFRASESLRYCRQQKSILERNGLQLFAISSALAGQLTCDLNNDARSDAFSPKEVQGDPEGKRRWAIEAVKRSAAAAQNLGVSVVTGLTGSSIWHLLYRFPPVDEEEIEGGYRHFADVWGPILDVFRDHGVAFANECHPTSLAYDRITAQKTLEAVGFHPALGFNFDPSHLYWQGLDLVRFIEELGERVFHTHMKDAARTLDGRSGILCSHFNFGDPRRGWDFRSIGRGQVDFAAILRALDTINYRGPLSVEWEDSGLEREQGARESVAWLRGLQEDCADEAAGRGSISGWRPGSGVRKGPD